MYRKKAVYGKTRQRHQAETLWDEAMVASPYVRKTTAMARSPVSTAPSTPQSIRTPLQEKETNIIESVRSLKLDISPSPLNTSTPLGHIAVELQDDSTLSSIDIDDLEIALQGLTTQSELENLLKTCEQSQAIEFDIFVETLLKDSSIRKLGEASYSEVFLHTSETDAVLKIIPFGSHPGEVPINDIIQELSVARTMCTTPGYIHINSSHIVRGKYPEILLQEWDLWAQAHDSESDRPDWYAEDQLYCVVSLAHGGEDLEHYSILSWQQAQKIFEKVVDVLAKGETEKQFEHRDLHWGNVLIRDDQITMIDYTLSRARIDDRVAYYNFADQTIFEAQGDDYQFEIYRRMKAVTAEDWAGFYPETNVLWLHYIVDKLLYAKDLQRPAMRTSKRTPTLNEEEIAAFKWLENAWNLLNPRRRYDEDEQAIESAERVLEVLCS